MTVRTVLANDPPWLQSAFADLGTKEGAGAKNNIDVLAYYKSVGRGDVKSDSVPWCAAFAGHHLVNADVAIPAAKHALLARQYATVGVNTQRPRRGDLVICRRGTSKFQGHVGFYLGKDASHVWVLGGNQSDAVTVTKISLARVLEYRRPVVARGKSPARLVPAERFVRCHTMVARWEGGYVNHPKDRGGPTNFGVIQRVYDAYRKSKKLSRQSVKHIDKSEVLEIYKTRYWLQIRGNDLPPGVDMAVYDFAVNSGTTRAAKFLQRIVGAKQDGVIGDATIAAVRKYDPAKIVNQLCDDRMAFLRGLGTWPTFGRGWQRRVVDVRQMAVKWAAEAETLPSPAPVGVGLGVPLMALICDLPWEWIVGVALAVGISYLAWRNRQSIKIFAHSKLEQLSVAIATRVGSYLNERGLVWPSFS